MREEREKAMLLPAAPEDLQAHGAMLWALACDPARSSYPTYRDGIKTRGDFFAAAHAAAAGEASELLLFRLGSAVEGLAAYFWIPEDRYLQLTMLCIRHGTAQALEELLGHLSARFSGYTLYFGFPGENREAQDFLAAHGFSCAERAWNHSYFFDRAAPFPPATEAVRITARNFDRFRAAYRPEEGTYWTADRIAQTLDDWVLFTAPQTGAPIAAILAACRGAHAEIFGLTFSGGAFQEPPARALLTACLNACRDRGAKTLTFLSEDAERPLLQALGFSCIGEYRLYTRTL